MHESNYRELAGWNLSISTSLWQVADDSINSEVSSVLAGVENSQQNGSIAKILMLLGFQLAFPALYFACTSTGCRIELANAAFTMRPQGHMLPLDPMI